MRLTAIAPAFLLTLGVAGPLAAADTYGVDPTHTSAVFTVNHLGVSTTWGRFNGVDGEFTWDASDAAKKIAITVKSESVDTFNEKRDQHLRSADFLNAKQFPTATFTSKSFAKVDDSTYTVVGDFTLMGVTKPLTLTVKKVGEGKDPWGGYRMGFDSSFTINRTEYGMKSMPGVGDSVTLHFALEGIKK